ncbi:hypothetical protein RNAN_2106 [Rheinheimera nanhaiensis E407-8]|uniref:Uncharacterized protein n=1 Tax=Rheinheimera nanhaiensis E407-8 TaxID=562729 RepID=I1DYI8_9GAMM|nr:hypothetical protein RNAN_2106 [Rheinheimera nanhaiensis E407-8]
MTVLIDSWQRLNSNCAWQNCNYKKGGLRRLWVNISRD